MNMKRMPQTTDADGGNILAVVGGNYRILATGKETNGEFATIEMSIPPGNGPGPHSHADFYETFYVVEGEVEVHSEAGIYKAGQGSYVVVPKGGVVHYFKNTGEQLAKLLCTVIPAGLETFFEEIGEPAKVGAFLPPPVMDKMGMERLQAIAKKHGQILYPPDFLK
jgi:quercetin dioxygenase-like cupin family protein